MVGIDLVKLRADNDGALQLLSDVCDAPSAARPTPLPTDAHCDLNPSRSRAHCQLDLCPAETDPSQRHSPQRLRGSIALARADLWDVAGIGTCGSGGPHLNSEVSENDEATMTGGVSAICVYGSSI